MAYGKGPKQFLDASARQSFLNSDLSGLLRIIEQGPVYVDEMEKMAWNFARSAYNKISESYVVGADLNIHHDANSIVVGWAKTSLEREQWLPYDKPLTEKQLRRQYYKDVGKVFSRHFEIRPEAWLGANFVLMHDAWFRTGKVDQAKVRDILSKPMDDVPILHGIWDAISLLSLSAWDSIPELLETTTPSDENRKGASINIGLMLADDPAQLHDRKSPARVRARGHMRRNMERWIGTGLATTALEWLRTFEWREGESGLSPEEVMLRAYAYMPDVVIPDNIRSRVEELRKIPI